MFTKAYSLRKQALTKWVKHVVDEVLISRSIFLNAGPSYSALSYESSYLKSYQNNANIGLISELGVTQDMLKFKYLDHEVGSVRIHAD